eukprot:399652_1
MSYCRETFISDGGCRNEHGGYRSWYRWEDTYHDSTDLQFITQNTNDQCDECGAEFIVGDLISVGERLFDVDHPVHMDGVDQVHCKCWIDWRQFDKTVRGPDSIDNRVTHIEGYDELSIKHQTKWLQWKNNGEKICDMNVEDDERHETDELNKLIDIDIWNETESDLDDSYVESDSDYDRKRHEKKKRKKHKKKKKKSKHKKKHKNNHIGKKRKLEKQDEINDPNSIETISEPQFKRQRI